MFNEKFFLWEDITNMVLNDLRLQIQYVNSILSPFMPRKTNHPQQQMTTFMNNLVQLSVN